MFTKAAEALGVTRHQAADGRNPPRDGQPGNHQGVFPLAQAADSRAGSSGNSLYRTAAETTAERKWFHIVPM